MIVLKILAAPFVVALTLLVAIVSFLYCVASALCHIGCVVLTLLALVLFIGGQTLGGVVFLVLAFLLSPFGIPAIADWLMDRLYSLKYSLQDFITYPVSYLQVNGFTFFKFHSKRNLGLITCERVKSR